MSLSLPRLWWRYCACDCDYWHRVAGHSVACNAAIVQLTGDTLPFVPPGGRGCPRCLGIDERDQQQAARARGRGLAALRPAILAHLDAYIDHGIAAERERAELEQLATEQRATDMISEGAPVWIGPSPS
jgi:hypothetical protein